jgi:Fungal rhodopsin domain
MYIGLASFATLSTLYWNCLSRVHNIEAVVNGVEPPYASMGADIVTALKDFFMVELFFWSTLWAVKLSLLCMFQKLTVGLLTYTRIWWGVLAFTILTFIGCLIGEITSCSSMQYWFSPHGKTILKHLQTIRISTYSSRRMFHPKR